MLTQFNFDDEFFLQGKLNNPKLTKSQKHQARHEHTEEQLRQKAGLGMSVAQFHELYTGEWFFIWERELVKEVVLSKMVCGTTSGHLALS